ncbi:MAG: hypothetical protein WKG01_00095 [Kofleriaceae bacterium]
MVRRALLRCVLVMAAGCGDPGETGEPAWALLDEAPASWMAVWGTSEHDVWVVGGRPALGSGPQLAHYDGEAWATIDPGMTGFDLWWVFGVPGSDTIYFGGSNGTILRYRAGVFEPMPTPGGTAIVFGIWGASDTDLWAVGSDNGVGFAWRCDGSTWTAQTLPAGVSGRLFKVHGQSATDLWIAGGSGTTLHWNGSALERVMTETPWPLFSVVTTPSRTVAVGGTAAEGTILEHTSGWTAAPVLGITAWRGVAAAGDEVYVVGESGTYVHHDGASWMAPRQSITQRDFHAAWIDPSGGLWAVGGDFDRVPLTSNGVVTYFGATQPRSFP